MTTIVMTAPQRAEELRLLSSGVRVAAVSASVALLIAVTLVAAWQHERRVRAEGSPGLGATFFSSLTCDSGDRP